MKVLMKFLPSLALFIGVLLSIDIIPKQPLESLIAWLLIPISSYAYHKRRKQICFVKITLTGYRVFCLIFSASIFIGLNNNSARDIFGYKYIEGYVVEYTKHQVTESYYFIEENLTAASPNDLSIMMSWHEMTIAFAIFITLALYYTFFIVKPVNN